MFKEFNQQLVSTLPTTSIIMRANEMLWIDMENTLIGEHGSVHRINICKLKTGIIQYPQLLIYIW